MFFTEQVFSIPYKRLCPNHKENKEKPMHHNIPHLYMLYLQALSCRHLTSHHTSFPNQTPQNIKIQLNEARDFATKRNFWPEPLIDYTNDTINSTQLN
ncbi:hypothetical protein ACH3Y3_21620, partial [Enterobacter hormaechei subsp. hoffmannii]